MARISRRSRNRTEDKRFGHKKARQATRRVLENNRVEGRVDSMHYSTRVEQPPVPDAPVGGPRPKKGGCKRNKYDPHVIEAWASDPVQERVFNEDTKRFEWRAIPWTRRRYHPPYRCILCGKGFYTVPKRNAIRKSANYSQSLYRRLSNLENEVCEDHYDLWNIRARLLDLDCRCNDCKET
jgi:hypothetical protein